MLFLAKYWELFTTNHINKIYEKYYFPDDQDFYYRAIKIKKQYIKHFFHNRDSYEFDSEAEKMLAKRHIYEYQNLVLIKAGIEGFLLAIGTCYLMSKLSRKLVLYPFIPVWWIGTNHREDVLMTYHADELFKRLKLPSEFILGREKERVLKILNTYYGKHEK